MPSSSYRTTALIATILRTTWKLPTFTRITLRKWSLFLSSITRTSLSFSTYGCEIRISLETRWIDELINIRTSTFVSCMITMRFTQLANSTRR